MGDELNRTNETDFIRFKNNITQIEIRALRF